MPENKNTCDQKTESHALEADKADSLPRSQSADDEAVSVEGTDHRVGVPSLEELRERLKAPDLTPHRPLTGLVKLEAELEIRSMALKQLSDPQRAHVDLDLLLYQLMQTIDTGYASRTTAPRIRQGLIGLYAGLNPSDAADAIVCRTLVGLSNSVMEAHARIARTSNPKALGVNFRHIEKGTRTIMDLVEARDRRSGRQRPKVRSINVESGAQAIIGDVHAHGRGKDDED